MEIRLGYEIGTGKPVNIPLRHLAVTGQTQESGKTTTLEAIITRSGLRAVAFVTKRGEKSFRQKTTIPIYFREPEITPETPLWKWVDTMLGTVSGESIGQDEHTVIIEACEVVLEAGEKNKLRRTNRKVKSLEEVQSNISLMLDSTRGAAKRACIRLGAYFDMVMPQLRRLKSSPDLVLAPGLNVMDLENEGDEVQALIIRSVVERVFRKMNHVVVIMPEAAKFIPNRRQSPVRLAAEMFIRQGLGIGNVLMLDSQDLANVATEVLKNIGVWILGKQTEINEVKRVVDYIPAIPRKIAPAEIQQLGKGQFFAVYSDQVRKVYVQPAGMTDEHAEAIANGLESPESWKQIVRGLDSAEKKRPRVAAQIDAAEDAADQVLSESSEQHAEGKPEQEREAQELPAPASGDLPACIYCANPGTFTVLYEGAHFDFRGKRYVCQLTGESSESGEPAEIVTIPVRLREIPAERKVVSESLGAPLTSLPANGHFADFLRQLRAHPEVIELLRETPQIVVRTVRPRVEWEGSTVGGRVAKLFSDGYFQMPRPVTEVRRELARRGCDTPATNIYKPLKSLAEMGFVTIEQDGYKAVPGMKIEQYEEK